MKMHVIGELGRKTILLMHPMSASHEVMKLWFEDLISEGKYCVLIPDLSSHGEDFEPYFSAERDAGLIEQWLLMNDIRRISLGYGASLGAITLFHLFDDSKIDFNHLWLEGMSFYEHNPFMSRMVYGMTAREQKKYGKAPELAVRELSDLYGSKTGRLMAISYPNITAGNTKRMVEACFSVQLPSLNAEQQRRIVFSYGSKDAQLARAKKILVKKYPEASLCTWDGYRHCEYPAKNPKEFSEKLMDVVLHEELTEEELDNA